MPTPLFKPGNPGKPKGAKNKHNFDKLRAYLSSDDFFHGLVRDLERLPIAQRVKYRALLLEYGLPRLKSVENNLNVTQEQKPQVMLVMPTNGREISAQPSEVAKLLSAPDPENKNE
jgi:hypothetical protein